MLCTRTGLRANYNTHAKKTTTVTIAQRERDRRNSLSTLLDGFLRDILDTIGCINDLLSIDGYEIREKKKKKTSRIIENVTR